MVKRRKAYLLFTLMIMAVLSLSVFSFCAYAAEDQQQDNTSAAVQSVDAEENQLDKPIDYMVQQLMKYFND